MLPPSSLVLSGMGLIDLPLRASNEGLLETARCASTGDSPGHPIPCWRTFSASCIRHNCLEPYRDIAYPTQGQDL